MTVLKPLLVLALLASSPGSGAGLGAGSQLREIAAGLGVDSPPAPPATVGKPTSSPWSREAQLRGLPRLADPDATVRFVVLGDIEPGRFWFTRAFPPKKNAFERQLAALQREEPAFVLQLGDTVSRGTDANFAELEEKLERVAYRPFFPVVGNHDRPRTHGHSDKSLFNGMFGDGDFHFDLGGCRFILMDNSNWELTSAQLAWLERALDTPRRKIVAMHIPPSYLRGRFAKPKREPKEASLKVKESVGWFTEGAIELAALMTRYRVDRVYFGHLHTLAYADYGGVRYVISGGGGSPLYRAPGIPGTKTSHYIVVEAGPSGITERIETLRGKSLTFLKP